MFCNRRFVIRRFVFSPFCNSAFCNSTFCSTIFSRMPEAGCSMASMNYPGRVNGGHTSSLQKIRWSHLSGLPSGQATPKGDWSTCLVHTAWHRGCPGVSNEIFLSSRCPADERLIGLISWDCRFKKVTKVWKPPTWTSFQCRMHISSFCVNRIGFIIGHLVPVLGLNVPVSNEAKPLLEDSRESSFQQDTIHVILQSLTCKSCTQIQCKYYSYWTQLRRPV